MDFYEVKYFVDRQQGPLSSESIDNGRDNLLMYGYQEVYPCSDLRKSLDIFSYEAKACE